MILMMLLLLVIYRYCHCPLPCQFTLNPHRWFEDSRSETWPNATRLRWYESNPEDREHQDRSGSGAASIGVTIRRRCQGFFGGKTQTANVFFTGGNLGFWEEYDSVYVILYLLFVYIKRIALLRFLHVPVFPQLVIWVHVECSSDLGMDLAFFKLTIQTDKDKHLEHPKWWFVSFLILRRYFEKLQHYNTWNLQHSVLNLAWPASRSMILDNTTIYLSKTYLWDASQIRNKDTDML